MPMQRCLPLRRSWVWISRAVFMPDSLTGAIGGSGAVPAKSQRTEGISGRTANWYTTDPERPLAEPGALKALPPLLPKASVELLSVVASTGSLDALEAALSTVTVLTEIGSGADYVMRDHVARSIWALRRSNFARPYPSRLSRLS